MDKILKKEIENITDNFISRHRKINWESEYENGNYCLGENKVEELVQQILKKLESSLPKK